MLQKILIFKGFCVDFDAFCEGLEMNKTVKTVQLYANLGFWPFGVGIAFPASFLRPRASKMEPNWKPKQPKMKPKAPKRYPRGFQKNMKKKVL